MPLEIIDKSLNGLVLFQPKVYSDDRGYFFESWRSDEFEEFGINVNFKQDNNSFSKKNVLRGMHFQWDKPQGKLLRITNGSALVVELDIRPNSPTLGKWKSFNINAANKHILWIPPGFANSFLSLEDNTEVQYKCTEYWNPKAEGTILWNDPDLQIEWNIKSPIISQKDSEGMTLNQWLKKKESQIFDFKF